MFIIQAKYLFLCDEQFSILENKAIVFDKNIIEIGKFDKLRIKFPNATLIETKPNSLILPAFINTHTHLEFSTNSYTLHFGDFLLWLKSVINSRSNLSKEAKEVLILNALKTMQKSGTGTLGEISSFGSDLQACIKSDMRVVFFNEILGLAREQNEVKKKEFLERFEKSLEYKNELFIPAISIHSAYSINLELCKFALNLAKKHDVLLCTHFLESAYERAWLKNSSGKFKKYFTNFSKDAKSDFSINSFLELFEGQRTLFTHCVFLKEFELLDKKLHSITHCSFSNFLLSKKSLNLKKVLKNKINIHIGTDGLSSNISLSMLDEMRANLLIHKDFEPLKLAKILLLMATLRPAKALNLNLGSLECGKIADFSVFEIQDCTKEQLPLQFILHAKEVQRLFIGGKECKF